MRDIRLGAEVRWQVGSCGADYPMLVSVAPLAAPESPLAWELGATAHARNTPVTEMVEHWRAQVTLGRAAMVRGGRRRWILQPRRGKDSSACGAGRN